MSTEQPVPPGQMRLYDSVRPGLPDGRYILGAKTEVTPEQGDLPGAQAYFEVVGPRFTLNAADIVNVYPPRNAQGSFDDAFPHVVLGRRTLPWERELDPGSVIADPAPPEPDDPEPVPLRDGSSPWLALLLFVDDPERSEVTVSAQPAPLHEVVTDSTILARLLNNGTPEPLVNYIEADTALLRAVAPTKVELQLLAHARQVNVEDRELSAGDSDGWFAIVMSNRLPTPGLRHRACLVSVEQRSDLIFPDPPAQAPTGTGRSRLVLLASWTFTAAPPRPGGGSFKELSQNLDVGLFATASDGYATVSLTERSGATRSVQYRGPLCPRPVERDPLGPYHSADQAIRIAADTGDSDISYAAAFEAGRLLGAADPRLAQELMRWRREAYLLAARADVADTVWQDVPNIPTSVGDALSSGMAAPVTLTVFERAGASADAGVPADVTGSQAVRAAPGLDPLRLATAWSMTEDEATQLLRPGASATPGGASGTATALATPGADVAAAGPSAAELQAARRHADRKG